MTDRPTMAPEDQRFVLFLGFCRGPQRIKLEYLGQPRAEMELAGLRTREIPRTVVGLAHGLDATFVYLTRCDADGIPNAAGELDRYERAKLLDMAFMGEQPVRAGRE